MGRRLETVLLIAAFCSSVNASPAPLITPSPTLVDRSKAENGRNAPTAMVTPMPATPLFTARIEDLEATKTIDRRGLGDLGTSLSSALHKLGEDIEGVITGEIYSSIREVEEADRILDRCPTRISKLPNRNTS
jgi:hypothetical protein